MLFDRGDHTAWRAGAPPEAIPVVGWSTERDGAVSVDWEGTWCVLVVDRTGRAARRRISAIGALARQTGGMTTFTRMDESTAEQWAVIGEETAKNQPRVAEEILSMLRRLEEITDGFSTNQMVHALQTATLAERSGADQELVVASLCHDIGKLISVFNHPNIAAEILKPYVREEIYFAIQAHQDFQGRHYYHHFGGDVNARDKYEGSEFYELAALFADEWDQVAFDPDGPYESLEHFEPMVREVFSSPKYL